MRNNTSSSSYSYYGGSVYSNNNNNNNSSATRRTTSSSNGVFERLSPTSSNNHIRSSSSALGSKAASRVGASSRFTGTSSSFGGAGVLGGGGGSSSSGNRVASASLQNRVSGGIVRASVVGTNSTSISNTSSNHRPPSSSAVSRNYNNNNSGSSSSSLPFSHTIGRVQDRNKLGLIEKDNYGHSPLPHRSENNTNSNYLSSSASNNNNNNSKHQNNNGIIATPTVGKSKALDFSSLLTVGGDDKNNNNNLSSPISGFQHHTPSRGLFSPGGTYSSNNSKNNNDDNGQNSNNNNNSNSHDESSFLLPSSSSSPGMTSNRASPQQQQQQLLLSPVNLITDLFHPLPHQQYKPSHPNHHHSFLLPQLEALSKRMKTTIRIPGSENFSNYNNNNSNSNYLPVRSPSVEDLTRELSSSPVTRGSSIATNNNSNSGATAGAFGKPFDRNEIVMTTSPPQHFTSGTNIFNHTIVFDLDETLCSNRGPTKAILRPGACELLRELAAIKKQLKQEHDKVLQQVSSVVTNFGSPPSSPMTGATSNNNYSSSSSSSSPSSPSSPKLNPNIRSLEIVLWTASMDDVAEPVVARLDPTGEVFDHLIYRDSRWFRNEANYTKDLRLLGRDFGGIVIVENSPVSVRLNRQNSILVKDFVGQSYRDNDLFAVKEVLLNWIHGNEKHFVPIDKFLKNHSTMDPKTNYVKPGGGSSNSNNNTSSTGSLGGSNRGGTLSGGIRW